MNAAALLALVTDNSAAGRIATISDLGTLPGGIFSDGTGINARGKVIGQSQMVNGDHHAFLYDYGTMTDLGTMPGGSNSWSGHIAHRGILGRSGD
ncbi:hypothetical protein DID96_34465 [Burkholderia sp. Bp8963]|uniref:hypothetical protein n=1 Tax=Burkholderia sp. Bp8963 TaxID=2184547 RepID=UPI000F5A79BE|nr:hypothetical protein [Burkholderia sp. Bp8963]RQS60654.1 hypothetical protein DID96_34465 [Burkholderia sp. Bp8963]